MGVVKEICMLQKVYMISHRSVEIVVVMNTRDQKRMIYQSIPIPIRDKDEVYNVVIREVGPLIYWMLRIE